MLSDDGQSLAWKEARLYKPVEFADFGGLDLRTDPQQTNGAIDLKNVVFDREGLVRTRAGTTLHTTMDNNVLRMGKLDSSRFFVWDGTKIYAMGLDLSGSYEVKGSTADTYESLTQKVVPHPTTNGTGYYVGHDGSYKLRKAVHGSSPSVSTVSGVPINSSVLGVQRPEDRLVLGNSGGEGRVAFSDPSDFETFDSNNYVQLPPDVGGVVAITDWNNLLFVFCQQSFFVFYGNTVNSDGFPEFNYRVVTGATGKIRRAVATAQGVFFVTSTGVWRTTGSTPVRVSDPISPLWSGRLTSSHYFTPSLSAPSPELYADSRYVYMMLYSEGTGQSPFFVLDTESDKWTYWEVPISGLVLAGMSGPYTYTDERVLFAARNAKVIYGTSPVATADNGVAIESYYRTGFKDLANPGTKVVVREFMVEGYGSPTLKTATDNSKTLSAGGSLTLGTYPAIATARDRRAVKGENLSLQIGKSSGAWSCSRIIAHVRNRRQVGLGT